MIPDMGVIFEYFAAGSDAAAAGLIDSPGGPGGRVQPPDGFMQAVRSGDRATAARLMRPRVTTTAGGRFVLPSKGIDPAIQLGTLESLLTGKTFHDVTANPRSCKVVASRDGDERLVLTLTDELQSTLAASSNEQLRAVAEPWSTSEEFGRAPQPESLAHFLDALADLARRATEAGQKMYCWTCL